MGSCTSGRTGVTCSFPDLPGGYSVHQHWMMGDINGDGKDDLVCVYPGGNPEQATVWAHLSTGHGFDRERYISQRLPGGCWGPWESGYQARAASACT